MSNKEKSFNWFTISKYRNEIFGIAIISVIIFHYCSDALKKLPVGTLRNLFETYYYVIGALGVEVFIFLSGMGLFFAMKKNPSTLNFYIRRLERILIAYTIWGGLFYWIKNIVLLKKGYAAMLEDFFFITFWRDGVINLWFVAFIIVAYLCFPVIYKCLKKENKYRTILYMVMLVIYFSGAEVLKQIFPGLFLNIRYAIYRIPIFITGVYCGNKIYEKEQSAILDKVIIISGIAINIIYVINKKHRIQALANFDLEYIRWIYPIALIIISVYIISLFRFCWFNNFLIATG